jgi:tRNA pseudouridine55 synthase
MLIQGVVLGVVEGPTRKTPIPTVFRGLIILSAPLQTGLYLRHKGVGQTSFSLVQAAMVDLQQAASKLKVCHGGTLDPFAEGLLLLLVGPATKVFGHLHDAPKTYVAKVQWGQETDTGDGFGKVVHAGDVSAHNEASLEAALQTHLGWSEQVPPVTSAKKVRGEPAYRRVHRGEEVSLGPSRVYLHSARWLSHQWPRSSTLELVTRGGFYVRSLARDIGRQLQCGAHLSALHRTAIGPWKDGATETFFAGKGLLPWWPSRALSDAEWGAVKKGEPIERGRLVPGGWRLPKGFPWLQPKALGVHQERVVALFEEHEQMLTPLTTFLKGL